MGRPHKIRDKTKTYNLLMRVDQYDTLSKIAHDMQRRAFEQVSVADLIRDAIDVYIEVIEEEANEQKSV